MRGRVVNATARCDHLLLTRCRFLKAMQLAQSRIGIIDQRDAMALRTGLAEHMSRAGSESLLTGRAAIDANDQSEPSSRDPVMRSAPRSQLGRRDVRESAAAVASRGFRLLKIPSGGISPFQTATTLQALCRKDYPHFFRALHGPRVAVACETQTAHSRLVR